MKQLLNIIPSWSLLKKLESLALVRSSYIWIAIVPIASKILAHADSDIDLLIFGHNFPLTLPFSWEQFFYCALFFSLGNIIFLVFAPQPIKSYSGFSSFEKEHEGWSKIGLFYKSHYSTLTGKYLDEHVEPLKLYFHTFFGRLSGDDEDSINYSFKICRTNARDQLPTAFWDIYQIVDTKWWFWRLLTSCIYLVGFGYMGSVIWSNIYFVISQYPILG